MKSLKEIEIFGKFAKICPFQISSYEKRDPAKEYPPKPDIFCKLDNGTSIAFELVEDINNSLKKLNISKKMNRKTGMKKFK